MSARAIRKKTYTTEFSPPAGWARSLLIHEDGMSGIVELRGWYPRSDAPCLDNDPDIIVLLHEDGRVEMRMSRSAPVPQQSPWLEDALYYFAGMAIGAARIKAKIAAAMEDAS